MFYCDFKFIKKGGIFVKLLLGLIKLKSKMKRPAEETVLVPERVFKLIHKLKRENQPPASKL